MTHFELFSAEHLLSIGGYQTSGRNYAFCITIFFKKTLQQQFQVQS